MAYTLQKPAPGASDPTAKNRVWDFFAEPDRTRPKNRRQPQQPRRKNRPCAYKTASGIPYWPSRDPIGEIGGINLYGFVGNDGLNRWDLLGLFTMPDYFNADVVANVFIEQRNSKALRGRSRSIGIWNSYTECCKVHFQTKIEDGILTERRDIYYYNPPKDFGDALLESIIDKLIDEAIGEVANRKPIIRIAYEISTSIRDSLQESSLNRPEIKANTLFLGASEWRFFAFTPIATGEWKTTYIVDLGKMSESDCDNHTKNGEDSYVKY